MRRASWSDEDGQTDGRRKGDWSSKSGQGTNKNDGTRKTDVEDGEEKEQRDEGEGECKRERERERRVVDGLDIVSAESSSIKSNYDVIDRGPVGRG